MKINQRWVNKNSILLPIFSGILFALTLPKTGFSILLWFSLVPLLIFISNSKSIKKIFAGGLVTGSIYFIAVLAPLSTLNAWWWVSPYTSLWNHKELLLWALLIVVGILFGGVSVGIFSVLFAKLNKNTVFTAFLLAISWGILEYIREMTVYGFTWGHLGFALHENLHILQLASIFGVYGISMLIVAVNILIFTIYSQKNIKHSNVFNNKFFYTIVILLICTHILGFFLINGQKPLETTRLQTVSVIHSPLDTEESGELEGFYTHIDLITEAAKQKPTIIVLPENIFPELVIDQSLNTPLFYKEKPLVSEMWDVLVNLSKQNGNISIVLGVYTKDGKNRHNSVVAMENGLIVDVYNKQILMFLSEAAPNFVHKFNINPLTPGDGNKVISLKTSTITPLICSEILYPRILSDVKSDFIVASSNDSVFDGEIAGLQNHIMAKFRAVENRTPVLRSVKGGVSSIIDSSGIVLIDSTQLHDGGVLTTAIQPSL